MGREHVETERTGEVGDHRRRHRLDRPRDGGDRCIGRGQHQQVDPGRRACELVAAAQHPGHVPSCSPEGAGERRAGTPGADDANGGQATLPAIQPPGGVPVVG